MAQSPEFPDLPWMPPRSYSAGRPEGPPRFITIHYTAGHEGWTDAENGALYDQRRTDGTSSHFYVDADSVVQCVRTEDRSHTALYHGNLWGIHFELCGTAQTREQWLDDVSRRTIRNAAGIAARCMVKWGIPLVRIVGAGVRSLTAKGVCGHYDWTIGWPEDNGDHTDPGPQFPWDVLFADIAEFLNGEDMDAEQDRKLYNLDRLHSALLTDADEVTNLRLPDGKLVSYPLPLVQRVRELAERAPVELSDVQLDALAGKVAALVQPSPPVDLAALASAVADELHRRTAD